MTHPNPHVADILTAIQSALVARENISELPSASTILILAWADQVRRDAEAACESAPEAVATAKYMARCIHDDNFDSIVKRHPNAPTVNRVKLPGTYQDHTEFRWPHDAVLDFCGNMADAVPLWFHYFRAISDVEHIKREAHIPPKREGFV